MVEFVIMLIIFMTLISGMLYLFRLHLYHFWAMQEARYLGFEQTWVPKTYHLSNGSEPEDLVEGDADTFKRPGIVSGLSASRQRTDRGSMTDLIPSLLSRAKQIEAPPLGLVQTAFASLRQSVNKHEPRQWKPDIEPSMLPELDTKIENLLHRGGFGGKFCTGFAEMTARYNLRSNTTKFASVNCPTEAERGLSHYIAKRIDIPTLVRELSTTVDTEDSLPMGELIESSLSETVANGFYSFFKDEVQSQFSNAEVTIAINQGETGLAAINRSIGRMLTDLRYIGSSAAISAVLAEQVAITAWSVGNRSSAVEKAFEDTIQTVLHIDASDVIPIIGDGYLLNPLYLPIPPKFGKAAGGFFSGSMRTALSLDDGMVEDTIEETVKNAEVTYDSASGLFPAATKRFRTGVMHTARFVIDTDPWHIHRREDGTGPYREKGGEFDQVGDPSEEGQLRRRVNGLWLFPTPPDAFFDPILGVIGLEELNGLVDAFRPIGGFISQIKSLLTNNPLVEIANTLSELPIIGSLIPKFPVWPVVRPDAYPGSTEMQGDKKMGSTRSFNDYVEEQRNFNPEPEPTFN